MQNKVNKVNKANIANKTNKANIGNKAKKRTMIVVCAHNDDQLLGAGGIQQGIAAGQTQAQNLSALQPQQLLGLFGSLGLGIPGFENIVTPPGPSIASQAAQIAGAAAPFFI